MHKRWLKFVISAQNVATGLGHLGRRFRVKRVINHLEMILKGGPTYTRYAVLRLVLCTWSGLLEDIALAWLLSGRGWSLLEVLSSTLAWLVRKFISLFKFVTSPLIVAKEAICLLKMTRRLLLHQMRPKLWLKIESGTLHILLMLSNIVLLLS